MTRFILYLLRWQLSTPILACMLFVMADFNTFTATVVANLVGGAVFFWVDRSIFKNDKTRNP